MLTERKRRILPEQRIQPPGTRPWIAWRHPEGEARPAVIPPRCFQQGKKHGCHHNNVIETSHWIACFTFVHGVCGAIDQLQRDKEAPFCVPHLSYARYLDLCLVTLVGEKTLESGQTPELATRSRDRHRLLRSWDKKNAHAEYSRATSAAAIFRIGSHCAVRRYCWGSYLTAVRRRNPNFHSLSLGTVSTRLCRLSIFLGIMDFELAHASDIHE